MILGPITSQLCIIFLGYGVPAYQSFKAASSSSKDSLREWLIYWCGSG